MILLQKQFFFPKTNHYATKTIFLRKYKSYSHKNDLNLRLLQSATCKLVLRAILPINCKIHKIAKQSLGLPIKQSLTNKQPTHFAANRNQSLPNYNEGFRTCIGRSNILQTALHCIYVSVRFVFGKNCLRCRMICLWKGKLVLLQYDWSKERKNVSVVV